MFYKNLTLHYIYPIFILYIFFKKYPFSIKPPSVIVWGGSSTMALSIILIKSLCEGILKLSTKFFKSEGRNPNLEGEIILFKILISRIMIIASICINIIILSIKLPDKVAAIQAISRGEPFPKNNLK